MKKVWGTLVLSTDKGTDAFNDGTGLSVQIYRSRKAAEERLRSCVLANGHVGVLLEGINVTRRAPLQLLPVERLEE